MRDGPSTGILVADLAAGKRFLRDGVYQALRDAILSQQIPLGQELFEPELSKQLGVSRTPLREALRSLEAEGLVVRAPSGGVRVREFSPQDIQAIYEVLIPLYRLSAELAAERWQPRYEAAFEGLLQAARRPGQSTRQLQVLHDDFHELVAQVTANPWLRKSLSNLRAYTTAYRSTLAGDPARRDEAEVEHRCLVELMRARDSRSAGECMEQHITRARNALLQVLHRET